MRKKTWLVVYTTRTEDGYLKLYPASSKKHTSRLDAMAEKLSFELDPKYAGYSFSVIMEMKKVKGAYA